MQLPITKNTTYNSAIVNKTAIVIGAGFGGLAAALRLRALGYQVTVLDKLDGAGGRARTLARGKYVYDAGPTVLTAPILFEELFGLFNEKLSDFVTLLPVKPWYRMQFTDGSQLDYGGGLNFAENTANIQAEIAKFSEDERHDYEQSLKIYRDLKNVIDTAFDDGIIKVAKLMKLNNEPIEKIMKYTGLTEEQIDKF